MEDDVPNVARFRSYYDYLDSLIAEEDIRYLQDGELARLIAELGYRGTGKTLTEKEYLEEIEKIEMAKKLKEINENAEQAGDLLGPVEGESPLVTAIKQRYKDNKEGRMNSVLFIYTKSESEEISGHIDLSARIQSENFLPYLTGNKNLVPITRDLTYLSWPKHKLRIGKSANWRVSHTGIGLVLRHNRSQQSFDGMPTSMQVENGQTEKETESWTMLQTGDKNLKVNCLDVLL